MKFRSLFIVLLVLSVAILPSCIQLSPQLPSVSEEATATEPVATQAATVPKTEAPTDSPKPPPVLQLWTPEDALKAAQSVLRAPKSGVVDVSKQKYTYTEMQEDLRLLAQIYPDHFSYRVIGSSVAGREIYAATIGNPQASRQIVVSAAIHAREYMTAMLVMKQMEFCLANYNAGTYRGIPYSVLFEDLCVCVVPMTNPDGVMLAQNGLSSLPVELRQTVLDIFASEKHDYASIDDYLEQWKANARGVDLNRNYDALWEQYDKASAPQSSQYKGESPASEPETQAMISLIEGLSNPVCTLCIHSQGEVLYWNCGQETVDRTLEFTQAVAERTGYYVVPDQNNDASLSDWCELEKGILSITVETGNEKCPLPIEQFEAIWLDNYDLFALAAHYFIF